MADLGGSAPAFVIPAGKLLSILGWAAKGREEFGLLFFPLRGANLSSSSNDDDDDDDRKYPGEEDGEEPSSPNIASLSTPLLFSI